MGDGIRKIADVGVVVVRLKRGQPEKIRPHFLNAEKRTQAQGEVKGGPNAEQTRAVESEEMHHAVVLRFCHAGLHPPERERDEEAAQDKEKADPQRSTTQKGG